MATLLLLLLACQPDDIVDADFDGVPAEQDCDDEDPFVYPGAPDDPGDGLDADCDGADPPWPFLGAWTLTGLTASYAGIPLFEPGTEEGTLDLGEDLTVSVDVAVTLDEAIAGTPYPIALSLSGTASPLPGDGRVAVWAEGKEYGELMHVDWVCEIGADADGERPTLACEGELKALDGSLDSAATFEAG